MNFKITILFLFIFNLSISQVFEAKWNDVKKLEAEGKIKSANQLVKKIHNKAKRKKDENQILKCLIYKFKFSQTLDENSQTLILEDVRKQIKNNSNLKSKAILNYIYAELLNKYLNKNHSRILSVSTIKNNNNQDFSTWSIHDFKANILIAHYESIKNKVNLRKATINEYKEIFEISPNINAKEYSLYDFIYSKYLDYLKNVIGSNIKSKTKNHELLFSEGIEFINTNFNIYSDSPEFYKIIITLQDNEKFILESESDIKDRIYFERISYLNSILDQDELFISKITELNKTTNDTLLSQSLKLELADYYYNLAYNSENKNALKTSLSFLDSIFKTNIDENILAHAETIKSRIVDTNLSISLENKQYSKQNNRALVSFKNIDTLVVKYYKFPIKNNVWFKNFSNLNKDSLVTEFTSRNDPFKTLIKTLPNKNDYFENSTEIILENLETGNYLIAFESKNYLNKKEIIYETIEVSNIIYVKEEELENDVFYVYDRKTGKPVSNVQVSNNTEKKLTNNEGKVSFLKWKYNKDGNALSELKFINEKDTIITEYRKSTFYDYSDIENESQSKAVVYFDRAIYRPGQTVYYKVIAFQNKINGKSIVPKTTFKVIIEDNNWNTLKEEEVQTNEFGSFTGEFIIPKNVMTGRLSVQIDEPDDYEKDTDYYDKEEDEHSFWDNTDFERKYFHFDVEEYKRPTFEITFDPIKENYAIGDSIHIKGKVTSLSGSNLTGAKISYSLTKRVDYNYNDNSITGEIETNNLGEFSILTIANDSVLKNNDINTITFNLSVDVTDINGETRTARKTVYVERVLLNLNMKLNNKFTKESTNSITIKVTNKNDYPVYSKGKIHIYKKSKSKKLLKRKYNSPKTQTITEEDFYRLFPHEPYNDYQLDDIEKKLVKTIDFDTEKSENVELESMKNWEIGDYEIETEIKDENNNLISRKNTFELKSEVELKSPYELFTFKVDSNSDKDNILISFYSVIPELYITTRLYNYENPSITITTKLNNGYALLKFNKKQIKYSKSKFHFSTFWENTSFSETHKLDFSEVKSNLNIEIQNFRNKIEPGSNENWSFKIKDQKLQTEILTSMYDSSLDQFSKDKWEEAEFYNTFYTNYPDLNFVTTKNISLTSPVYIYKHHYKWDKEPELNWFGFDYSNDNKYYSSIKNKYKEHLNRTVETPIGAKYVYGVVSDALGPLGGANVVVQGTTRGTTTDFDGNYGIFVKKGETLEVTYTGMKKISHTITNYSVLNLVLEEDVLTGSEVVVVGALGIKKRVDQISSSTQMISAEEITQSANPNIIQTLAGKVSGLQINTTNNGVNATTKIVLRGNRSVSGNNEALIVIDGVISTADILTNIEPNLIQDISVLIGSQGVTLYGEQGANGVIIVTTKKGLQELTSVKTRTNFNETAFFYPHLTTDKEGVVAFNFKTPESLTKWNLRLLGHNKNAEIGYFETSIISQKDIMIIPNMPRFVRENDSLTITAKITNLTQEVKTGTAILLLFDATNGRKIDSITSNLNNKKNFSCKAKENTSLSWNITIPEGLQGLQYKVIAKSENFSDGEENILPVLSNKILITESIPLWVRENSKREVVFENLKNSTSTTLQNHLLTLEYATNPIWFAIQSLPYLMEYEHECAEQTFSRYYANTIATEIITTNDKIAKTFESWKNKEVKESKLEINEELKSILLAETPWFFDTNDNEINKNIALLFNLNTLKESSESTLKKLKEKQLSNGSFPWFSGGSESPYITQHIVAGLGHLISLFPNTEFEFSSILDKAISNIDSNFIKNCELRKNKFYNYNYIDLHYLYTRSFYLKEYPISTDLDKLIQKQLEEIKKNWLDYSLYQKAQMALIYNRFNQKEFARKITTHLEESSSNNEIDGMYWVENTSGYYWYQSAIETQALIIEAFSEIKNDTKKIDLMKVWLIKNKQAKNWATTKSTSEAIYALLLQGSDWTLAEDKTKIQVGNHKIQTKKITLDEDQNNIGYIKTSWKKEEITKEMATISIDNNSKVPGFGGVYWQYFESIENINSSNNESLSITKELHKKEKNQNGEELIKLSNGNVKVGDLITVRLIIKSKENLEFVHLKDLRATCFEPKDVISTYKWGGLSYYMSTKDVASHFFFDEIKKGTYVIEYELRVNNAGVFNNGVAKIQSMYAPEFSANSTSEKIISKQ